MDSKELKEIMEAYSEVYAPQEVDEATAMAKRGYDETKLRKRAGGGEAADRATSLEDRPTFSDSKTKQRQRYARAQRKDFRNTASSNPGLHVGQHKSDDPKVKAKQAARGAQRGALTPNERKQLNMGDETFDLFDVIMEFLCVEGYAETLEDAEWIMANIIDEEAIDIILGEEELDEAITSEKGKAKAAEMIAKRTHASGRAKAGQGDNVALIRHIGRSNRDGLLGTPPNRKVAGSNWPKSYSNVGKGSKAARRAAEINKEEFEAWLDEAMTNYEKNRKRAAQRAAARNEARAQGKTGAVPGVGYVTPRRERETWTDESGKTRHAKGL